MGSGPDGYVIDRDVMAVVNKKAALTPLAANMAKAQGISTDGIEGTGAGGKITVDDIRGAAGMAGAAVVSSGRGTRTERMSGMRKAIMNNMLTSKQINAQTSSRIKVDMTQAIALRNIYKEKDIKISYNDIIAMVCAKVLTEMPAMNASVSEDGKSIVYHDYVNIGTAVSVQNGLIVPVIKDADIIGLTGIAKESQRLIEKARNGQLTQEEYHGGTFTISSLGMFGLEEFVAIINPPEAGILAVGKLTKTPVVVTDKDGNDTIAIKPLVALTLSYDHRIVDGAESAKFLQKVQQYLENPLLML